ncbi:hypothetical protein FRB96_003698 [Tulasnella sp. 330]|nr:hypothetical protein FRB96_003698 [Tulasnella sp. 330]
MAKISYWGYSDRIYFVAWSADERSVYVQRGNSEQGEIGESANISRTPKLALNPDTLADMFTLYNTSARPCFRLAHNKLERSNFENRINRTFGNLPGLPQVVWNIADMKDPNSFNGDSFPIIPDKNVQSILIVASLYIAERPYEGLRGQGDARFWKTFQELEYPKVSAPVTEWLWSIHFSAEFAASWAILSSGVADDYRN